MDQVVPQKVLLPTVQALVGGTGPDSIVPPQMPLQDVERVISAAHATASLLLGFTILKAFQPSLLPMNGPLGTPPDREVTVQQWPARQSAPIVLPPASQQHTAGTHAVITLAGLTKSIRSGIHPSPLRSSQEQPPSVKVQQCELSLRNSFLLSHSRTKVDLTLSG